MLAELADILARPKFEQKIKASLLTVVSQFEMLQY